MTSKQPHCRVCTVHGSWSPMIPQTETPLQLTSPSQYNVSLHETLKPHAVLAEMHTDPQMRVREPAAFYEEMSIGHKADRDGHLQVGAAGLVKVAAV